MKVAMLLISVLFLATAVEALPGGGGRQLGKGKKPNKKCKVDVCWKKCQKLKDKEEGSVLPKVLGSKCDIAFMEDCLEKKPLDCSAATGKKKKKCKCWKKCKDVFDQCKANVKTCKKNLMTCQKECKKDDEPEPQACHFEFPKGKKRNKCCEQMCKKDDDKETCIETCIAA